MPSILSQGKKWSFILLYLESICTDISIVGPGEIPESKGYEGEKN